ncbi:MDR family MFS transporter [Salisediminibacterium selenitireducens]|uniref:Drug resistance transporter, EmrB/QacA subfamily n=1 Tax=Bacillus selenitireducens (strain ATCC 700615 / DSM 15326 / MLS10) TaxID=439292 RepID=D6XY19_BACIE|nr:MDR family MFS transporter [Salisediminibacterium selenitireducens]ADH98092.1 drug resistance transporter, EmrB/QacA subfamily [[Bacillus] selenitireducens MLS10]
MFTNIPLKWLVVITVLTGTFTVILNNSMLNPAVPYFMQVFDADAVSAGWVITIFMVAMGMSMPLTGYLADKFGKKQVYIAGLLLFVTGSVLGSMAWDISAIILFRALQGVGGGMIMPLSMVLIFDAFPREERGLATGVWGVAAMLAPTIGPTLGGVIVELGSWQWLFLVNIPTGLLAVFFSLKFLPKAVKVTDIRLDKSGFVTVTIGVGAILFALGRMNELSHLYNPVNLGLIAVGSLSLWLFVKIEAKQDQPLLDLSIFKIKAFTYSVIIAMVGSISLFGGIFLIPLLVQNVYGYGAIVTGLSFLPSALMMGLFMNIGGRMLDVRGPTLAAAGGLIILSVSTGAMGFLTMGTSLWLVFLLNGLRGVGLGLSNMPSTTAGMNSIPEKFVSRGSAMGNVIRQMSSALGIVFVSIYFEVRRAQIMVNGGMDIESASLSAINEAFVALALITLITVPLGFKLGREYQQKAG